MIRKLCVAGVCALAGVMLLCTQAPTPAQGKKDDQAKQIQELKKKLAERDEQIKMLKQDAAANKKKVANANKVQKDLDAANQSIKDKDAQIATLQDNAPKATAELSK